MPDYIKSGLEGSVESEDWFLVVRVWWWCAIFLLIVTLNAILGIIKQFKIIDRFQSVKSRYRYFSQIFWHPFFRNS